MKSVEELRKEIFADGKVTKEEFLSLWDTKDSMDGDTSVEFDDLFAEVGIAYLMEDGVLSDEEAQFLIDKINEDEEIDDAEDALLAEIATYDNVSDVLKEAFPEYFEEDDDYDDED